MIEKENFDQEKFIKNSDLINIENNNINDFIKYYHHYKQVNISEFLDLFIINNCDNFVIDDIFAKILEECFDIAKTQEIQNKFEKNEKEFLKYINSVEERSKLKRVHSDLGVSKLTDQSLKTFPLKKKKTNQKEKSYIKSSSESMLETETNIKSNNSISVDAQSNNITINNNAFYVNSNNSIKHNTYEFNFKNIKEKLMDRSYDPFKNSNNNLLNLKDNNGKKEKINAIMQNQIKNNESTIFSLENEKSNCNAEQFIGSNYSISRTDKVIETSFQNNEANDSFSSEIRKANLTVNSLLVNSYNRSTNFSNKSLSNNLSFGNFLNNNNQDQRKSFENSNFQFEGIDKNNNNNKTSFNNGNLNIKLMTESNTNINPSEKPIKQESIYRNNRDKSMNNCLNYNKNDNKNFAKNKLSSGINAKLNYNIINLQKLKKEKSKKKNSKNKPELINKLFEKLTEKIIKSEKNSNKLNKEDQIHLNQKELIIETNNKQILPNELIKDLRQKVVDEYFEKVNQENSKDFKINEEKDFNKFNLKDIINDKFYIKKFTSKNLETLENPKYSKRKNSADINNQFINNLSKENNKPINTNETILLEKYSDKRYNLLKLNNKYNRSVSEEPPKQLNSFSFLSKNEAFNNEKKLLNKSPMKSHSFFDNFDNKNQLLSNDINNTDYRFKERQENNISSDDEVLAYSTPTKIQINKNFRKTSKDKDLLNQKTNISGINLLNLFRQIKK